MLISAIPSLRARDCSKNEKEALNYLFLLIPLLNVIIPFFWKSFAVVWSADTVAFLGMYAWKVFMLHCFSSLHLCHLFCFFNFRGCTAWMAFAERIDGISCKWSAYVALLNPRSKWVSQDPPGLLILTRKNISSQCQVHCKNLCTHYSCMKKIFH